jgi:hypothetical protein
MDQFQQCETVSRLHYRVTQPCREERDASVAINTKLPKQLCDTSLEVGALCESLLVSRSLAYE